MTRTELEQHIDGFNLGELGELLFGSIKRGLRLRPYMTEVADHGSRFGGLPYTQGNFVWPMSSGPLNRKKLQYESHQYVVGPLRFICQINLSEVPFLPDGIRVSGGDLLQFFASNHKSDFPLTDCERDDWRIISTVGTGGRLGEPPILESEFVDALADFSDAPVENGSIVLPCCAMGFEEHWQMDHSLLYGQGNLPLGLDLRLAEMPMHLFGGYPDYLQSPVEAMAAQYRRVSRSDIVPFAQFDSDSSLELNWSGGGRGYFLLDRSSSIDDLGRSVLVTQQ